MSAELSLSSRPEKPKLPEGWREMPLISVAEARFSSVDKLTHTSEEPVRLCNYTDVYNNDYITGDFEFMRASATQPEISRFGLQVGDVIITKDSETPDDIGIPTVVDYSAPDLVYGYHLALIRPDKDEVDPTFLAKQLSHDRLARYFGQQANGLTRYGLPIGAVNNAPLWLPEPGEQKDVGVILRLMDEAIAKTEAVIAKLRQVRAGLLHDLLTRGLDKNGQLRDPIAHPEQFQDSPLGRIPREWDIKPLESCVLSEITYGIVQAGPHVEGGVPYIRTGDMSGDQLLADQMLRTSPEIAGRFRRSRVQAGEIVCAIRATVGKVLPVPPELDGANLTQGTARIAPKAEIDPSYLLWTIRSDQTQRQIAREAKGTTFFEITLTDLRRVKVLIPSRRGEQEQIAAAIRSLEARLSNEADGLGKLTNLKSGLMTDLLTGRVRVPATVELAPASANGATSNQPGATPQVSGRKHHKG